MSSSDGGADGPPATGAGARETSGGPDRIPGGIDGLARRVGRVGRRVVPAPIRRRYAAKLGLSILLVVVVVALIGGAGYAQIQGSLREDTRQQMDSRVTVQADALGSWVQEMQVQTRMISAGSELRGTSEQAVRQYLTEAQTRTTLDVVAMHVVDADRGEVIASTVFEAGSGDRRVSGAAWAPPVERVQEVSSVGSAVTMSDVAYERDGERVLAFASPVPRTDRVVVLVGSVEGQFGGDAAETDAATAVVNSDEQTVVATGTTGVDNYSAMAGYGDALENGSVSTAETAGRVLGFAPVAQTDWVVVRSLRTEDAYAIGRTVGQNVLLVLLGCLVSLLAVGSALTYQTVRPLKRLRAKADRMADGDLDVELSSTRDDEVGRLFAAFEEMRASLSAQMSRTEAALKDAESAREEAESARAEAEAAQSEAEALSATLERRATQFSETVRACAEGDLTRRLDADADNEAMREIGTAFNEMMDELEATVAEVQAFADEVADSSADVAASADDVETGAREMAADVRDISTGADEQYERLQSTSDEVATLSANVEEVAATAGEVAETAERATDRGETARASAERAVDQMGELEAQTQATAEQMERLDDLVGEIGEISEFIADIAEQTNMLALNANIEAAGAGADGDGFAVVADEVKTLAEETRDAASDIEDLVDRVQAQTDRTVDEMADMRETATESVETVEEALTAVDHIVDEVNTTASSAAEIDRATDEQAEAAQRVAADIDEVTDTSSAVSDRATDVAEAADAQTESVRDVTERAESLQTRAGRLADRLDEFTIDTAEHGEGETPDEGRTESMQ